MSNATAVAPERATKATSRAKAANFPATTPAPKTRPELSEDDYRAIAVGDQIFHLLSPITAGTLEQRYIPGYEYISEACDHAWDLTRIDAEWTEPGPAPTAATLIPMVQANLHHAMIEMLASTDTSHVPLMYCVRLLVAEALEIASRLCAAYQGLPETRADMVALTDFQLVEAGARQFRDRPSPPIRRADGPTDGQGPYNHAQLCSIVTEIASVALTLDRVLMLAQLPNDDWDTSVLIDTAQLLARQLGGMADSAVDGQIIGTHDVWNYGPNFAALGKAGAA